MSLKLRELWNECEKMDPFTLKVFLDGLKEIAGTVDERFLKQVAKPCVANQKGSHGEAWTAEEEDLLHECCKNTSIRKGVHVFREKTGYKRTQGACELRAKELKRRGRW